MAKIGVTQIEFYLQELLEVACSYRSFCLIFQGIALHRIVANVLVIGTVFPDISFGPVPSYLIPFSEYIFVQNHINVILWGIQRMIVNILWKRCFMIYDPIVWLLRAVVSLLICSSLIAFFFLFNFLPLTIFFAGGSFLCLVLSFPGIFQLQEFACPFVELAHTFMFFFCWCSSQNGLSGNTPLLRWANTLAFGAHHTLDNSVVKRFKKNFILSSFFCLTLPK